MGDIIILTSKVASESEQLLALVESLAEENERVALLFVSDGVYALVKGSASESARAGIRRPGRLVGCREDIEARGLAGRVTPKSTVVDYGQMVDLMMSEYSKVVSYL